MTEIPHLLLFGFQYGSCLPILVFINCRFLRGVSYWEFSRLVYGILGNRRIPLPACAYVAIRREFLVGKDEHFTGFDLDEED